MNLAEDYFSKKYFPNEISPENFENRKIDCQILFFDRVFRRHHGFNDPINTIDSDGKCPICAVVIISAIVGAAANVTGAFLANNLTSENFLRTAATGAVGGVAAALTGGALSAAATLTTAAEIAAMQIEGSSIKAALSTLAVDLIGNVGLNSPPPGVTAQELQKGTHPACSK
jgi:hypothetical protein